MEYSVKLKKCFYLVLSLLVITANLYGGNKEKIQISDSLEIIQLTENCYLHISYYSLQDYKDVPANGLVYLSAEGAYIIDTPWTNGQTNSLLKWIEDSLKTKTAGVIAGHWHKDCMGGLETAHKADIKSYGHELTQKFAKENKRPVPKIGFNDSLVIGSGEDSIVLKYLGGGHTKDNIFVWLPKEKILFGGCPVKALGWNSLGFTGEADLQEWPKTLKKAAVEFKDADIVVPGHGKPGGLELIEHTLGLLENNQP